MKLGFVLSLVSALQICQQSVLSSASSEFDPTDYAIATAAFPLGKFVSTLFLAFKPCCTRRVLKVDAWLLIVGSVLAAIPTTFFLTFGRFLIGCGAGLGFVASTVLLFELISYPRRPAHFFVLGIAFAFATFMINLLQVLKWKFANIILFSSVFTGACGCVYLLFAPSKRQEEIDDDDDDDDDGDVNDVVDCVSTTTNSSKSSNFPYLLVYVLMILNVSIGVPITLGYSILIFESFGTTLETASILSVTFPLAQIVLILILYFTLLDRRLLIIGGYSIAVFLQAVILITSIYPFLPPKHYTAALSILVWMLSVVVSVPCNTALCLISEQFVNLSEQMEQMSKGRSVLWILAALSTGTFPYCLHAHGFFISFLPYFLISSILLFVLYCIYPKNEEQHFHF